MRYEQLPNGDYLDAKTNLVWKQHPEVMEYTYDEALGLQQKGWRLPTIEELVALMDYTLPDSFTLLPNSASDYLWSASLHPKRTSFAWLASFINGNAFYHLRDNTMHVRLVRDASKVDSNPIDDAVKAASLAIDDYLLSRVDPVLDALYEARDAAIRAQRMLNEISK